MMAFEVLASHSDSKDLKGLFQPKEFHYSDPMNCLDKEIQKHTESTNAHQLCNNHRIDNEAIKSVIFYMHTVY